MVWVSANSLYIKKKLTIAPHRPLPYSPSILHPLCVIQSSLHRLSLPPITWGSSIPLRTWKEKPKRFGAGAGDCRAQMASYRWNLCILEACVIRRQLLSEMNQATIFKKTETMSHKKATSRGWVQLCRAEIDGQKSELHDKWIEDTICRV